ncbi:hypothetical protein AD930_06615 [Acetobacter malorum]|nr:hypothetical protein AD930_06615 [Acetobacter malorum]
MSAAEFPILMRYGAGAGGNGARRLEEALRVVLEAKENGSIRNTDYKEAKSVLNQAVSRAWAATAGEPFFYAGKYKQCDHATNQLYDDITLSSLNEVRFLRKKIDTARARGASGPAFEAIQSFESELSEMAIAVQNLGKVVVKGRVPRPAPPPSNPHQIRGTCPCCFSNQAVMPSGRMAHHGYVRPYAGGQSASCHGIDFSPYERSPEGVSYEIKLLEKALSDARHRLSGRPGWTVLSVPETRHAPFPHVEITRDHPRWEAAEKERAYSLMQSISSCERSLPFFREKLEQWQVAPLFRADGARLPIVADRDGPTPQEEVDDAMDFSNEDHGPLP